MYAYIRIEFVLISPIFYILAGVQFSFPDATWE